MALSDLSQPQVFTNFIKFVRPLLSFRPYPLKYFDITYSS